MDVRSHAKWLVPLFGVLGFLWFHRRAMQASEDLMTQCRDALNEGEGETEDDSEASDMLVVTLFIGVLGVLMWYGRREWQYVQEKQSMGFTPAAAISYRLDYYLSTNPLTKPTFLLIATYLLILLGGVMLFMAGSSTFSGALFSSWLFVADTAFHADFEGTMERVVGLIITVAGMVVFGFMIGIVTDVIAEQVDDMKKGKAKVLEDGHTLILGFSDRTLPVLKEIGNANESEGGGTIVILATNDKEEMEQMILESDVDLRGTRVVCRSGDPILLADLKKVSAAQARSIIVLAIEDDPDESDARALRVLLSLLGLSNPGLSCHVVVELCDIDNAPLVKMLGKERVETVVAHDLIGRLMIQSSRQSSLAQILDRILGFDGSEFYMANWPELNGKSFDEAVFWFQNAILIGIKKMRHAEDPDGRIILNPPGDTFIEEHDLLIVLAEDDDTYEAQAPEAIHKKLNRWRAEGKRELPSTLRSEGPGAPERLMFVGWRRDIDDMIQELDTYVPEGSSLTLLCGNSVTERLKSLDEGGLDPATLQNLSLHHVVGSPVSRRHLEKLQLETYNSVLILADETSGADMSAMDSRTLASLLLIRDIRSERCKLSSTAPGKDDEHKLVSPVSKRRGSTAGARLIQRRGSLPASLPPTPIVHNTTIISEILDSRTKSLIEVAGISDYVASNELVSKALAMVSEEQEMNVILSELLSAVGNEIYVRRISLYARRGERLNFWQLTARARAREEVALGYVQDGKIVLNPEGEDKAEKLSWGKDDTLIVIADD